MSKPLALIIEDDRDLGTIFEEAMQAADYETEVIRDGLEALQRLKAITPYLVLLDMHLPGVDGVEILTQIRADARLRDVKVVITTADPGMTIGETSEMADFVFIKPIRFSQLSHLASRLHPNE